MTYKDAGYWHGEGKFEKAKPSELLATIIRSDNYHVKHLSSRAERLLKSLDESIAFFIELLQVAYKNRANWQESPQIKASVAMANGTLNYLFIARHAVILGYGHEAQMLYRGCFERMTRAIVFQTDERVVKRFWNGKQINQSEINNKISRYLEKKNEKGMFSEIYQSYKQNWKILSELSHPNLGTVAFRILSLEGRSPEKSLGIDIELGGMSNESVISGIIALMMHISFSLSLMKILVSEYLGKWNNKLERKYSRFINLGFDIPLTELERQMDLLERYRPQ
ncbi:hypothetical protein ACFLTB_04655 [Chloroflexota bacterium]